MNSIPQKQKTFDRIIKNLNINAKFNDTKVTSVGSYIYLELFKQIIGIKSIIERQVSYKKASNSIFTVADIIDYLIDASILGFSRFLHTEDLRRDKGFLKIKEADRLPSEKVCRDLLKELPLETLVELRNINKQILDLKSQTEEVREVCINFDDTVVTIFGNQEGCEIGYNPRYHGRPSFKEKVGIIAGTDELLDITLESGKHHSNYDFLTFFKDCKKQLPKRYILKRVRLDRGFFDEDNFLYFEEEEIEYVVKCKMYSSVKKIISYINENPQDYQWQSISSKISVTEITLPLPSWQRARRFVIVRKQTEGKNKDQMRIEECFYDYQVIVTNIDYLTGEEIFQDYNQRCDVENKIDEIKEGFAFDENSLINHKANELYLLIKMIAYNIQNWFKQAVMPNEVQHHEISTLRRLFYRICCNICGNGNYRHLSFSPNNFLEKIITHIKSSIALFANKFCLNCC